MKTRIESFFVVLKNRQPLIVATGDEDRRGMLVFTDHRFADRYVKLRGGAGLEIEQWGLEDCRNFLASISSILESGKVEWLIVDHPGQTSPTVLHLKIQDLLQTTSRSFRLFTVPSPTQ